MNIDTEFECARIAIHVRIDAMADLAIKEIREHTARAMDAIRVQVGWMNRSAGQVRRYARAQK